MFPVHSAQRGLSAPSGTGFRRVYLSYPSFQKWQRLELAIFLKCGGWLPGVIRMALSGGDLARAGRLKVLGDLKSPFPSRKYVTEDMCVRCLHIVKAIMLGVDH